MNFVALLGWNPGTEQEIFTLDELIKAFSIEQINKAGAVVDADRLNWFNNHHIRGIITARAQNPKAYLVLKEQARPFIAAGLTNEQIDKVLLLEGERIKRLDELGEATAFLVESTSYNPSLLIFKKSDKDKTICGLQSSFSVLGKVGEWSADIIKDALDKAQLEAGLNPGDMFWPIRVALSGRESSPPPQSIAEILGREVTLQRLEQAIKLIK